MFDFEIGQQIVCITGRWRKCGHPDIAPPASVHTPQKGHVYIVSNIVVIGDRLMLELQGFTDRWNAKAFRPCKRTSIEQFRHHLVTPPKKLEPV